MWYVIIAVLFLIGGFALYKHRLQVKAASEAGLKKAAEAAGDAAEDVVHKVESKL